jgi:CheY-like chemotaxis protein
MDTKEAKKAILAVDDDPKHLELLGIKLTEAGYKLVVVQSGKAALETIKIEKPGLVLLDILMPEMDGFETLKRIKEIDPDIPVAMVTSVWDDGEGKRCFEAGAFEYITKPIDFNHLKEVILLKFF